MTNVIFTVTIKKYLNPSTYLSQINNNLVEIVTLTSVFFLCKFCSIIKVRVTGMKQLEIQVQLHKMTINLTPCILSTGVRQWYIVFVKLATGNSIIWVAVNQTLSRLRYLVEVGWQTFPPVARLQLDNRRYRPFPVVVAQLHQGGR